MYIPSQIFLCAGVGKHHEKLTSFEVALRNAGLAPYNLVRVSSILPPRCNFTSSKIGVKRLTPGQIVHCVLSEAATDEPGRMLAASIGVAVPADKDMYGYLSEHHSYGQNADQAGDYAEDLAATMLATTLGENFDPDKSWNERKEIWKISGKIVRTRNITKAAIGDKRGQWTTVVAGAVLLPPVELAGLLGLLTPVKKKRRR